MKNETKLLSCPFCGGEAFMYQTDPHESVFFNEKVIYKGATFIECAKCSCALSGPTKEYVIKAWNTRKPMERILERLEEESFHRYNDTKEEKLITLDKAIEIVKKEGEINV